VDPRALAAEAPEEAPAARRPLRWLGIGGLAAALILLGILLERLLIGG
jgi:hypothetical protein